MRVPARASRTRAARSASETSTREAVQELQPGYRGPLRQGRVSRTHFPQLLNLLRIQHTRARPQMTSTPKTIAQPRIHTSMNTSILLKLCQTLQLVYHHQKPHAPPQHTPNHPKPHPTNHNPTTTTSPKTRSSPSLSKPPSPSSSTNSPKAS